jgi:hypothetical protein
MLIVGSVAANYWSCFPYRTPGDLDVFCTAEEFTNGVKFLISKGWKIKELSFKKNKGIVKVQRKNETMIVEASYIDGEGGLTESNKEIYEYCKENSPRLIATSFGNAIVAPAIILYLMKVSHKFKKDCPHFLKTRSDILYFESNENLDAFWEFTESPELQLMLAKRQKLTYTNSLPKLNTDKKEFFTDSVPYKYDHDTIHEAVKMLDKPAYMYYIKDGEQVLCDMQKFKELPEIVKLCGVLEESFVLALERAIIPFGTAPKRAFDIALQKVCTSITSGPFRQYAWENYDKVQDLYHESFVTKFNTALSEGKILPYQGGAYAQNTD